MFSIYRESYPGSTAILVHRSTLAGLFRVCVFHFIPVHDRGEKTGSKVITIFPSELKATFTVTLHWLGFIWHFFMSWRCISCASWRSYINIYYHILNCILYCHFFWKTYALWQPTKAMDIHVCTVYNSGIVSCCACFIQYWFVWTPLAGSKAKVGVSILVISCDAAVAW